MAAFGVFLCAFGLHVGSSPCLIAQRKEQCSGHESNRRPQGCLPYEWFSCCRDTPPQDSLSLDAGVMEDVDVRPMHGHVSRQKPGRHHTVHASSQTKQQANAGLQSEEEDELLITPDDLSSDDAPSSPRQDTAGHAAQQAAHGTGRQVSTADQQQAEAMSRGCDVAAAAETEAARSAAAAAAAAPPVKRVWGGLGMRKCPAAGLPARMPYGW